MDGASCTSLTRSRSSVKPATIHACSLPVIKSPKGWMVRHASTSSEHAVIDTPFGEYVEKMS